MSTEIAKPRRCLVLNGYIEKWIDEEQAAQIRQIIQERRETFYLDGELITRQSIVGIFRPETMDSATRRKNGQWQCNRGTWHDRGARCECETELVSNLRARLTEARRTCQLCHGLGTVVDPEGRVSRICHCSAELLDALEHATTAHEQV